MSQDFFAQVMNPLWKNLPGDHKRIVIQNVLRFFINPLVSVDEVREVSFSQGGVSLDTFELVLDGVEYVFIPGQEDVVLGWDGGLAGLNGLDCSEDRQELRLALNRYLNSHINGYLFTQADKPDHDFSQEVLTTRLVAESINQSTSPLRKVTIPPMIVEKRPQMVGFSYLGLYSSVTGRLQANYPLQGNLEEEIEALIQPEASLNTMFQELPRAIRTQDLYIQQDMDNPDNYHCWRNDPLTYLEAKQEAERMGMGLMNEDEWEYCCGAGTRRLFAWGNQLHRSLLQDHQGSPLWQTNGFGLVIAAGEFGPELIEGAPYTKGNWLEETYKAPVLNLLPLSSYYHKQLLDPADLDKLLFPGYFCYRRAIRIEF